MNASRSVPGKTFLLGEYVALDGGPSICLTTEPRFVLRSRSVKTSSCSSSAKSFFAKASPAGRLLAENGANSMDLEFADPHRGKGGLGASSAQFALLYSRLNRIDSVDPASFDWPKLLEVYRRCAWSGEGASPSGADLVAQMVGGVCYYDGSEKKAERLSWNFPTLSFTLLRTGVKLATHEHLKRTKMTPNHALRENVLAAYRSFQACDERKLIEATTGFAAVLAESGMTSEATLGLLRALRAQTGSATQAAKGCGAMGADVIAILHEREAGKVISDWAESKGLEICGTEATLASRGLVVEG